MLGFFAAGLALWLATSSNARYGLLVLMLAGVCLARVLERLLPHRALRVTLAVLLALQVGMTITASPARWFAAEPWSLRWLAYDAPERARRERALYVTVEALPMAAVAPFVNPASAFVNFRGQYSIAPDSPRLADAARALSRPRANARPRARARRRPPVAGGAATYDATLRRIGYRVDTADCFEIPWRPDVGDALSRAANRLAGSLPPHEPLSVASCALRPVPLDPAEAEHERRMSALFDRIESACPRLFRGQTAVTEPLGSGWSRNYGGLDARLESNGRTVLLNRYRAGVFVDLGAVADWERPGAKRAPACL